MLFGDGGSDLRPLPTQVPSAVCLPVTNLEWQVELRGLQCVTYECHFYWDAQARKDLSWSVSDTCLYEPLQAGPRPYHGARSASVMAIW